MALSPSGMQEAVLRNLQNRTGKNLAHWIRMAKRSLCLIPSPRLVIAEPRSPQELGEVRL
jgi:hypothetical protein